MNDASLINENVWAIKVADQVLSGPLLSYREATLFAAELGGSVVAMKKEAAKALKRIG